MSPVRERLAKPVTGYGLVVVLLTCISLCVASLVIALASGRASLRQFCDIVTAQTEAYQQNPPSTPAGRNIAGKMEALSDRLQCPPSKGPIDD